MSSIVIAGDTSGSVTLQAPAVSGSSVLTLPAVTDTVAGIAATQTLTNKTLSTGLVMGASTITSGTSVASTSGTSVDFTGIPSWVKKISVLFDRVTLSSTSSYLIRLGTSSGFETTGYKSQTTIMNSALATLNSTVGFIVWNSVATVQTSGMITIANVSGNNWIASGATSWLDNTNSNVVSAGSKSLGAVLDRVQILSSNGADTFTGGTLNIMYEG
jgi:hypothetical protein